MSQRNAVGPDAIVAQYVALSWIEVPPEGEAALREAFAERLGAVDDWEGFDSLELLADRRRAGRYLMVSRWRSEDDFRAYMRSADHRASHARIPGGPHAPKAGGFDDFDVVAT